MSFLELSTPEAILVGAAISFVPDVVRFVVRKFRARNDIPWHVKYEISGASSVHGGYHNTMTVTAHKDSTLNDITETVNDLDCWPLGISIDRRVLAATPVQPPTTQTVMTSEGPCVITTGAPTFGLTIRAEDMFDDSVTVRHVAPAELPAGSRIYPGAHSPSA